MLKETLIGLGLTANEVEIYLTLLKGGELTVNEIGSKSGLHRQVCYDALDRLLEKGFVSYVKKEGKKVFKALEPKKILDYLDEKKQEIDTKKKEISKAMPELLDLFKEEKEETEVEVIKGKNVMRTIYKDIFATLRKKGGVLYAMGIDEGEFLDFDEIALNQHIQRFKKYKLKEKLLTKEGATEFVEGPQSEYKMIPEKVFNPNPTQIYGDKIAIIIWGRPGYGIIIKNRRIADAYRKYFEIMWKTAKKRK